ncbi:MAG TPA: fused MFS/spermidine synthase [Vicinamibacterales bacterium]|nr:fused MFS/spermidine synthase [Vicinamibacterales bacterium]
MPARATRSPRLPASQSPDLALRLLLTLYGVSGAAALIYEVAWTRLFTLELGHTVAATSSVLAAFMGGLALGAWLAGQALPTRWPLRGYAVLEIVVAVVALLLPLALRAFVPVLAWAYADGSAPVRFSLIRVAISLFLLGIPATAMGATFPIAASWMVTGSRGARVSGPAMLYAANTAGAALGALAAGFWLIPAIGLRATTWTAALLNLVAACGAFLMARQDVVEGSLSPEVPPAKSRANQRAQGDRQASPGLACTMAAISGWAALVYEVAWTRLLALVIGPTTYAFSTMAAAFITGLAIGSTVGTRVAARVKRPGAWLAGMLILSALAAPISAWYAATKLPLLVAAEVADPAAALRGVVATQAFIVVLLLLPMTAALGAVFPLALAVAGGAGGAGRNPAANAAWVYVANTVGAIAGALLAGFLIIPQLGLRSTFEWTAVVGIIAGASCLAAAARLEVPHARKRGAIVAAAAGIAASVSIVALPSWDHGLLASGAYKYAPYLMSLRASSGSSSSSSTGDLDSVLRAGTLEYYKEGAAATVSVRRLAGTLSLSIDGKIDASNAGDMLTQRLLGLVPVLLHHDPHEVCIIGLGSGVTLDSALATGTVRHADVVEISPEVVAASHYFDRENQKALDRPEVRLIVGDGRSHLMLTPHRYDVIVSEPSNPWMAGVASLFTREFFEAARARLNPDGLFCQWAHTYDIGNDDLRSIVRSFGSVFPQTTLWLVGDGDLLLIGTTGSSIEAHLGEIEPHTRLGNAPALIGELTMSPSPIPSAAISAPVFELLSLYAGGPSELERYGQTSSVIQTDDRMTLEFSAPRGIYGRTSDDNSLALRALIESANLSAVIRAALNGANDRSWTAAGVMNLKAEAYRSAYEDFRRAVTLNPRNPLALTGLSDAAGGAHRESEERVWLEGLASQDRENAQVRIELSRVLAAEGQTSRAVETASEASRLAPNDPRAGEQLASVLADAQEAEKLEPLAASLAARYPERPDPAYYRAEALFLKGKAEEALEAVQPVVAGHPDHARAQNLLGAACATLGRRDCARTAFEASLKANPRDPATYVNLGQLSLESADAAAASGYFADALALDPTSPGARAGLAQARALSGGER